MHPVIRIASFLVIAVSLAQLNHQKLITAAIILLLLFFIQLSFHHFVKTMKLVYRLRWLFVSILIIYAWFTPGTLLIPQWGDFSPYKEGMITGLMRISALIMILLSVSLLVLNQTRNELISSIYWYCRPLSLLGVSRERLAVRLLLTMESVNRLEAKWLKTADNIDQRNATLQNRYQRIIELFGDVVETGETDKLKTLSFSLQAAPRWYQWFIPFLLALLFYTV
ncbi:MAG: CbiQ family ECF transporter T component [Thioalkalispiraceae bacterium]|jgi:energy-coupling factor transport system permease protein